MAKRRRQLAAVLLAAALLGPPVAVLAIESTLLGRPVEVNGHLELRQVFRVDDSTAKDRFQQQAWIRLRYDPAERFAVETTFSGQNGGPTTESSSAGAYEFDEVFQSLSPSFDLHEAFLQWHGDRGQVRAGLQKMAWGRLDRVQPTDVLNSRRFADPFLLDDEERKLGTPALSGSYALPALSRFLQEGRIWLGWLPKYVPFRFPRFDERWFPPAAVPPAEFVIPPGTFPLPGGGDNPAIAVPIGFETHNGPAPAFRVDRGWAARFSALAGPVDYSLCYYHGYDAQPAFDLTAEVFPGEPSGGPLGFDLGASTELTPAFRVIDLWGADAAWAWRMLTFRAEGAYVAGRPFSRDLRFLVDDPSELADEIRAAIPELTPGGPPVPIDLPPSFVARDALEWGLGADTTLLGWMFLLQLNQTDVFHNHVDLLIEDVDTRLTLSVRKSFWHEDVELHLVGVQGIESGYSLLLPRLTYLLWDRVEFRAGYLFMAGRKSSVVGQYKKNDEAFLRLRYLF